LPRVCVHCLTAIQDAALRPFYIATSKPAQRAYLSTILFFLTSLFLLGTAITAYVLFYYAYIPARGFSRPIYLQFGPGHHPYGLAALPKELISNQPYDVKVALSMPRTPSNTAAGNFMLDLQLLAPGAPGSAWSSANGEVLAHETRPAILTYHSTVMEHVHKAAALPLYVLGLREESESLDVRLMDGVNFARGWRNIPATARLELQSENNLQVYSAKVVFSAKLQGLRYVYFSNWMIKF
jgi:seipin